MRFQFTLRRLLLGTTMFALVLGLAGKLGGGNIACVLLASTGLAALVILVQRRDITRLIYSFVFTGIGLFIAVIMVPPVMQPGRSSPMDELYFLVVGATDGWILGCVALRLDNRIKARCVPRDQSGGAGQAGNGESLHREDQPTPPSE